MGAGDINSNVTNVEIQENIYLLKVKNRYNRKRCKICPKLTIKTPERRHWHHWTGNSGIDDKPHVAGLDGNFKWVFYVVKNWVCMDLIWEQRWVANINGKRDEDSTGR